MKLKKDTATRKSNPREELLDEELIGRAILECLKEGDSEGVIEVIRAYLEAVNKNRGSKSAKQSCSTPHRRMPN